LHLCPPIIITINSLVPKIQMQRASPSLTIFGIGEFIARISRLYY
jgi:hypothetical protein